MPRKFTVNDLTRVLCAVDTSVMFAALRKREETCPSTLEVVIQWLELVEFILDILPIPFKKTVASIIKRLVLATICAIQLALNGAPVKVIITRVFRVLRGQTKTKCLPSQKRIGAPRSKRRSK